MATKYTYEVQFRMAGEKQIVGITYWHESENEQGGNIQSPCFMELEEAFKIIAKDVKKKCGNKGKVTITID